MLFFLGYAIEGAFGWRYLLSPAYRKKVRARWEKQSQLSVVGEVGTLIMGFVCFNILVIFLIAVWLQLNENGAV